MEKGRRSLLIIFYKNPVKGRVKTRLAATLGDLAALDIYRKLAAHTRDVTIGLSVEKTVYYSDRVDGPDMWPDTYQKLLQQGNNLGERMENAFRAGFSHGYHSICIIGTDCYEITREILSRAFDELNSTDAVIGPARDGGYYLLGMNRLITKVFQHKMWSAETVLSDTIKDLEQMKLKYRTLPELRDVDTENDLPENLRLP